MILSIESSCDDSSIAISRVSDYALLFHQKISQDIEHSKYGGVVPEIASRLHAVALPRILHAIPKRYFSALKAIAVTNEPGLSVSLIEGVMMAKALSIALKLPLISTNHLKGHIYSLFLEQEARFPLIILLLSGGHSLIMEAQSHDDIKIIASTLDDSFGESFDKVAKMLNLGYPGGPIVESMARNAVERDLNFPIPLKDNRLAFSFSGLKNAVRLHIEKLQTPQSAQNIDSTKSADSKIIVDSAKNSDSKIMADSTKTLDLAKSADSTTFTQKPQNTQFEGISDKQRANICYAFQNAAVTHIAQKMESYLKDSSIKRLGIVGGASANKVLRAKIELLCKKFDKELLVAPLEFCSDNAAMIGRCGIESYKRSEFVDFRDLDISPHSSIFG